MTSSRLHLRFQPDTDETGELFVRAERDGFAGAASAWFTFGEVRKFGEQLASQFPLPQGSALTMKGGYWARGTQHPSLEETLVGLTVYAVGSTGTVGIAVELMEGVYEGQRAASRAHVRLEILTDSQTLQSFGLAVASLVLGGDRAVSL